MRKSILKLLVIAQSCLDRDKEKHEEFLEFYENLIMATPANVARAFGNLGEVECYNENRKIDTYGIELNPQDYLYWKSAILESNFRFVKGVAHVERQIFNKLCSITEKMELSEDEKKAFFELAKSSGLDSA